jgi:hypothetical protein
MIRDAVFSAMHSAEPTGQQVADFAQTALKNAKGAASDSQTKAQNNSTKMATAVAIAPTACVQAAAPAVQSANAQQEQDASKTATIVDALANEADQCKTMMETIGKGQ